MAPIKSSGKAETAKYTIDCTAPVNDKIFDMNAFVQFLNDRIKVEGHTHNFGEQLELKKVGDAKVLVVAHRQFSGRYLKYLTKKYLKKHQLRDWLRVVSVGKGTYELRFFNVVMDNDDDEDEE